MKIPSSIAALLVSSLPAASALCPLFGFEVPAGAEDEGHASWVRLHRRLESRKLDHYSTENMDSDETHNHTHHEDATDADHLPPPPEPSPEYAMAVDALDIEAVQADIKAVMTDSKDWWPADYGNYGPLFVRLAWHCSGTFRNTDGRGGCAGGRQRFFPEMNWEDNTNLDKARRLLWPVKEKYGLGLSWGDLFVMAGTTAIEAMGGPTLGVCVGRVDDVDGARSAGLDMCPPGEVNGDCTAPMGATTEGLIYVNPEGPMAQPIPGLSADQVRNTFSRMGMNDSETVALIGGGHSFGKAHGACSDVMTPHAAGLSPYETKMEGLDPDTESWLGKCGKTGVGADAWTSGFEGPWTFNPIGWDNSYFTILQSNEWSNATGPGGHQQWHSAKDLQGRGAFGVNEQIMMFTSDVALLNDPQEKYQGIVKEFAENPKALDEAFAAAWHKLTTSAFGNEDAARCTGAPLFNREAENAVKEAVADEDKAVNEDAEGVADEPADETVDEDVGGTTDETTDETSAAGGLDSQVLLGTILHLLVVQVTLFYAL